MLVNSATDLNDCYYFEFQINKILLLAIQQVMNYRPFSLDQTHNFFLASTLPPSFLSV